MRPTPKRYFWMMLIVLLTACNLRQMYAPAPTATATDSPTIPPTETPTPGPVPTEALLPLVKVDGLRMAYILEGNLYVQDSGGEPRQLTRSGKDHTPSFSDDGEKIIFYREERWQIHAMYVINADGTREHRLVTNSMLMAFDAKYTTLSETRTGGFVPGTHQLLFNTQEFASGDGGNGGDHLHRIYSNPNNDLFIVDTDTFEIKMLASAGDASPFQESSDEKMVSIEMRNSINIIGQDGQALHRNKTDNSSDPSYIYWIQNLKKLTRAAPFPNITIETLVLTPYTLWQYALDGDLGVERRLNPPPITNKLNVSSDGNWIVYDFSKHGENTENIAADEGIYLGNLRDGTTKLINKGNGLLDKSWSSDNIHFILSDWREEKIYLGNIDGQITPIAGERFLGWLDDTHYLYLQMAGGLHGQAAAVGDIKNSQLAGPTVKFPVLIQYPGSYNLTYIYIKPK